MGETFVCDLTTLPSDILPDATTPYLFTIVDWGSKYGWAFWTGNKRADTIVDLLQCLEATSPDHRPKTCLKMDNGGEFVNAKVKAWAKARNLQIWHGRPYTPSDQGAVEAFNKTLKNIVSTIVNSNKWLLKPDKKHELLRIALYQYNSREHSSTGEVPMQVFPQCREAVQAAMQLR